MPVKRLKTSEQQVQQPKLQPVPKMEEPKPSNKTKKVQATVVEHFDTDMKK